LIRLTRQYNNTIAKLNAVNNFLAQEIENTKESKRTVLYGKKITVKCKTSCYIHHIIMDNKVKPSKYVNTKAANQTLKLDKLKVKTINDWKCPVPNFNIDDISVKESINGILMRDLQEKTLKISGDQEVSGNLSYNAIYIFKILLILIYLYTISYFLIILGTHIFINLHTINASIPLDIATNSTRQIVQMREARVKELYLTEDEFFLPLNGSMTVMNGSITATKVRVTGLVELKGGITGKGIEKLAPMKYISTPLILDDDYFLQDVIFSNLVKTKDIVRIRGPSLKEISENRIPLDSNVPVHLTLSSDKTVIIYSYFKIYIYDV